MLLWLKEQSSVRFQNVTLFVMIYRLLCKYCGFFLSKYPPVMHKVGKFLLDIESTSNPVLHQRNDQERNSRDLYGNLWIESHHPQKIL